MVIKMARLVKPWCVSIATTTRRKYQLYSNCQNAWQTIDKEKEKHCYRISMSDYLNYFLTRSNSVVVCVIVEGLSQERLVLLWCVDANCLTFYFQYFVHILATKCIVFSEYMCVCVCRHETTKHLSITHTDST
jgi:hypothetical protein